MICDDSAVVRGALARALQGEPEIEIVARVGNGAEAVAEVARLVGLSTPVDVLLLDIEMPVMDGMQALPLLLRADPKLLVVMASTQTTRGADIALRALRMGAADYIAKPSVADVVGGGFGRELIAKLVGLTRLRRRASPPLTQAPLTQAPLTQAPLTQAALTQAALIQSAHPPLALRPPPRLPPLLVAIGSSTGGPQALFTLLPLLGAAFPLPVVLTQHMPASFTGIFASHLSKLGGMPCAEAVDSEPLLPGRLFLAPGGRHLLVDGAPGSLRARISDDPPENFCRPSVDPMLRSAAAACDGRVLVVMLTGMGQDGLRGAGCVVNAGGSALAQDEASSVVWGMPGAIARAGLCHQVLPVPAIAAKLRAMVRPTRIGAAA